MILLGSASIIGYMSAQRLFFFDNNVTLIPAKQIRSPDYVPEAQLSLAYLARELDANATAKCTIREKSLTIDECERLAKIRTLLCIDLSNCRLPDGGLPRIVTGNPRLHYIVLENTDVPENGLNCVCDHPAIHKVFVSDEQLSGIRRSLDIKCSDKFTNLDTVLFGDNYEETLRRDLALENASRGSN